MKNLLLALYLVCSLSALPVTASEFTTYCQGELNEAEKHTLTKLFEKVLILADFSEASCKKLEEKFLTTTNINFSTSSGLLLPPEPMKVTDISVLKYFPHLQGIVLRRNPIKDISPLKHLTKLEIVDLLGTEVEDLSPLAGISTLRRVGISESKVTKIASLGEDVLKELTELHAHRLELTDWDALTVATKLTVLEAPGSNISTLASIKNSTALSKLKLKGAKSLASLDDLPKLTGLTDIEITDAPATKLNVEGLVNVTQLIAENIPLTEVPNLSTLVKLQVVSLDNTKLTAIPEMAPTVTLVSVWHNPITDLSPLKNLPNLAKARLLNTNVTDLTPLAGLKKLVEVDIRKTPVTDVTPLKDLIDLADLYVGESQVTIEQAKAQLPALVVSHANSQGGQTKLNVANGAAAGGGGFGIGLGQ